MSKPKQLKLAAYIVGTGMHVASWRHPDALPEASIDFDYHVRIARTLERGKFDAIFFADSLAINDDSHPQILNRFDPAILLAALARSTSKIGLVATASTTYSEPYVLARQFASIDHISGGRAGWNVVTTGDATGATALNFSRDTHVPHEERYRRAEEFVDVVRGLWNSWEDDAFVYNKEAGIFYDREKVHALDYKGEYFSVRGPLNIARSVQGQPVLFQAGSSEPGQQLAARTADVVFAHKSDMEAAQQFYQSLKTRLPQYGRTSDDLTILHSISPVIGETEADARRKYEELQSLIDPYDGLRFLSGYMGNVDFSQYPLDTPAADVVFPEVNGIKSQFEDMLQIIQTEKHLKVRDLYHRFFGTSKLDGFIGTPVQVADEMERWLHAKAADGFMLQIPLLPEGIDLFVEQVIPILQARGLFRKEYEGSTLREHLGLAVPSARPPQSATANN